jgi:hypothetical protein
MTQMKSSMKVTVGVRFLVTFHACLIIFQATGQTTPELKFREGRVWVIGLGSKVSLASFSAIPQEQWAAIFRVYTHDAWTKRLNQPVAGTYLWEGDNISFKPNLSFVPGQQYHGVFAYPAFLANTESKQAPEKVNRLLEVSFLIPQEKATPTYIENVHPQASVLPENILRMYISFSSAMMPGEAYHHITLLTEDGTPVDKAFLIIDQELWDAERKRFTLLFDPGRVKRGIQSNVELGAPVHAGQTYRLVVDAAWRDAQGNALASNYVKTFTATPAERTKLTTNHWKITTPDAGTYEPLIIKLDRPIDYALALKFISVTATQSGNVKGKMTLTNSTNWRFTPDQPWTEDQFYVEVNPQLEDVAGNNFNNAFDIDLSKESRRNSSETIKLPFTVGKLPK